eukprot:g2915.t1
MKKAQSLLADKGVRASNWFIHTPVCCPSRGELLSGRYFHSIRNPTPKGGCMHVDTDVVNPASFGTYLGKAGYTLGYFGKHMNQCPHNPPPGWDCPSCYWFANGGGRDGEPGGYLNATFSDFDGGEPVGKDRYHKTAGTYQADTTGEYAGYTTSVIANKSIAWIKKVAKQGKPFMVTVASKGPHVPSTPAPWYAEGTFIDSKVAPRDPSYNASAETLADHHWLIAQQSPITDEQGATIDELFRNRWRTLLSIDDAIEGVVNTIDELGLTDSTYFFVTSDHGYNLGQHRLPSCKLNVYDHDIRIPMVIKGPGIKAGASFDHVASNVDVAPTMLGLAGVASDGSGGAGAANMDGKSVASLLFEDEDPSSEEALLPATLRHLREHRTTGAAAWRDHHFVEYYSLGNVTRTGHLVDDPNSNTYRALRFMNSESYGDFLYAEFTAVKDWNFSAVSFHEAYDVKKDPYQLNNVYESLSEAKKTALAAQLHKQWQCHGQTGTGACP